LNFPKEKFSENLVLMVRGSDGVGAFLEMSHVQRAFVLRQFVAGIQPRDGDGLLSPKTIKSMIDGFVRSIKEIESNSDMLTERFGEWSWSKSAPYVCVKQALKNYSFHRFEEVCENKERAKQPSNRADALKVFSFAAVHSRTLELASTSVSFRTRLLHLQRAAVQIIGCFCGNRAITEMHEMKVSDFKERSNCWMEYDPTGVTKSTKVNAEYQVVERASSFIVGRKNCDLIRLLASHRSLDSPDRLFLKVQNNVEETDEIWFANQHVGVNKIGPAISEYANALVCERVIPEGHYTNTSMRKLVVDRLAQAGCPELLVASAIGHYVNGGSSISSGFGYRNLSNYITGVNDDLTR
jgi:hypothetical protein